MTKRLIFYLLLGALLCASEASLSAETQEIFRGHIQRGLDLTYQADYEEALEEFDSALALDTISPTGYLFKATCLETYMIDYDTRRFEGEFYALLDLCQVRAEARLRVSPGDGWARFFLGVCHAYRAVHDIFYKGSYISGVSRGFRTIREFERAFQSDSSVYDAYLGIGVFDWSLDKMVSKLPLIHRNSDEAVEKVERAAERGVYSRVPAKSVLAWMHVVDERYDLALPLALELCRDYPRSRFFKVLLGSIYLDMEVWDSASTVWGELYDLTECDSLAFYPRVVSKLGLARSSFGKGDYGACVAHCEEALLYPLPEVVNRRLRADLDDIEKLRMRAEEEQARVD